VSRDLIISEHALRSTLDRVAEKSSFERWESKDGESNQIPATTQQVNNIMQAAIIDPVGLSIFARQTILGESYREAAGKISHVVFRPISESAGVKRATRIAKFIRTVCD